MIHSFLLIGQSNMGGRGVITDLPLPNDSRIFNLRNGKWRRMYRPVNPDRVTSGVCLAESFAKCYADDHEGVSVGLIPCADGGSNIDQWHEGGLLFDHAVYQCLLAQRTSNIAGILWHQGEGDCGPEKLPVYEEKLLAMVTALRRTLKLEDVPFLIGGLGDFLPNFKGGHLATYTEINKSLQSAAKKLPLCSYVPAEGLEDKGDSLHFSARALWEFGERYYAAFTKLEDKNRIFPEKPTEETAVRSAMELL